MNKKCSKLDKTKNSDGNRRSEIDGNSVERGASNDLYIGITSLAMY